MNVILRATRSFLILDADRRVRDRHPFVASNIATRSASARICEDAGDDLARPTESSASIALYRESAAHLLDALIHEYAPHAKTNQLEPERLWAIYEGELADRFPAPKSYSVAREALTTRDAGFVESLPLSQRFVLREEVAETVRWLRRLVEPRTAHDISWERTLRVLAFVALVAFTVFRVVAHVRALDNVALGAAVTASSRYSGTPTADGATNGTVEKTYGVHTNSEESAWVQVELPSVKTVTSVRVYPRGDGYANEGVPIVLEISTDGVTYTEVDRRIVPFAESEVWDLRIAEKPVRFVRVRRLSYGYIALSEIEVYAKKTLRGR